MLAFILIAPTYRNHFIVIGGLYYALSRAIIGNDPFRTLDWLAVDPTATVLGMLIIGAVTVDQWIRKVTS